MNYDEIGLKRLTEICDNIKRKIGQIWTGNFIHQAKGCANLMGAGNRTWKLYSEELSESVRKARGIIDRGSIEKSKKELYECLKLFQELINTKYKE